MAKHNLHPGAMWLFRLYNYPKIIIPALFFIFFISSLIKLGSVVSATLFVVFSILIFIIIAEVYIRMYYNRWIYEFTTTNLKLERGVIWKKYSNIPYERVQNVDIHRGILARIFGFSSVMIQTAGYSGFGGRRGIHTEGYIPAVDVKLAEKIRDYLMKKISKKSSSGGL